MALVFQYNFACVVFRFVIELKWQTIWISQKIGNVIIYFRTYYYNLLILLDQLTGGVLFMELLVS